MPQATLSTTANQDAINGNPHRVGLTITNTDSANVAYLSPTAVYPVTISVTNAAISIGPGLSRTYTVAWQGRKTTQSAFAAISAAGSPIIVWEEQFD